MSVAIVVLAAGAGARVGAGRNKALLAIGGAPLFVHSLRTAAEVPEVTRTVLVVREEDRGEFTRIVAAAGLSPEIVAGGATRHDSEWAALGLLAADIDAGVIDTVAIHDAARPLATPALFELVVAEARVVGGAIPGRPRRAVVRRQGTEPLPPMVAVQTPQAFEARPLLQAYRRADDDGFAGTDTASCLERYTDLDVTWIEAPSTNIKVTYAEDLAVAEGLLAERS